MEPCRPVHSRTRARTIARTAFALGFAALLSAPSPAAAQYFGRNKVQYDRLDFRVLPTDHFKIHFYPAESLATVDASRMAERWYARLQPLFDIEFSGNPLIFYADAPDFQQSNVIEGEISQGTGGVTEGLRERVIMPFTGTYAETDHVLGHELVHVFQYRMAGATKGGLRSIENIPLWLIEGMAEYLSLGRNDANTAMWLRDALRRNDLPTLDQLTRDPRYFPYRYGQALWAFIGGTWGDQAITRVFRDALELGWERGVANALGMPVDTLSARWHAAIRAAYTPVVSARTPPLELGRGIAVARERGEYNISPAVSPDGRSMAYFSSRGLFGVDIYVADVSTGRVIRQLTSATRDAHFDALSFISSAGSWSPDGRQLAFAVYAQGDQEINIADARSGRITRRIRVDGVTAMSDPAWSPDGNRIAFAGFQGGLSDLFVYDLRSGRSQRLTNDREAQLHPAWSPDNTQLVYVTDADPATSFTTLQTADMRLATIDVESGRVQLLPRSGPGKHINPQFAPDGRSLYYVADHDGVSDIYQRTLATGEVRRLTSVGTGISGITPLSPAISVARETGALLFSVFDQQGFSIRALDTAQSVAVATLEVGAGILPPAIVRESIIERYLTNAVGGLPASGTVSTTPYRSNLRTEYIGGPQIGIAVGGAYGAGLSGGISISFADELRNHNLQTVVLANGQLQDFGGQMQYMNRVRRWNWGLAVSHVPFSGSSATAEFVPVPSGGQTFDGVVYTQTTFRQYYQTAQLITQYPLSNTRRLEFGVGGQRVAFSHEVDSLFAIGEVVVDESRTSLPTEPAITYATASAAFVGDYSVFAFTSPVAGGRYRFELTPTVGNVTYTTALADYRRYLLKRPFTFAFRGMHVGRYGRGAESEELNTFYVGMPYLVRGYDRNSFDISECESVAGDDCPALNRLSGSRVAVLNAEFRIPLFGTRQFGLINFPYLPLEVSPFVDAGLAWSANDDVSLRFARTTSQRVPVVSAGVTTRVNVFGYAILEAYWAKPFQRPTRGGIFGFQLRPGW